MGNNTLIYVDKDTRKALKKLAGDKPVAAFLRDLAFGKEQAPVPVNELDALRETILRKQNDLEKRMDVILSAASRQSDNIREWMFLTTAQIGLMGEVLDEFSPGLADAIREKSLGLAHKMLEKWEEERGKEAV